TRRIPEIDTIFAAAGGFQRGETNKGILFLELVDRSKRKLTQQQVMAILRKELNKIPGVKAYIDEITLGGSHGERTSPLQFDIKGFDLNKLASISDKIISELKKVPGVVDVGSNMELTKPEVRVYIDRNKAGDMGVDILSIAQNINTMIGGQDVTKFKEGGKSYDVRVRLIADQRKIPEDIDRLLVRTQKKDLIRLSNVVDVREEIGPNIINRKDRMRSVTIYGNLENKPLGEAVKDAQKIAGEVLPEGYSLALSGSAEQMRESFLGIIFALGLAVVVTYMILAAQFESFIHPFTIMLAVPLSMIGALGYLWITGNTINIMSMIGMIMLTGLVVKNSILLVDYTIHLRSQGMERNEAVLRAGKVRLRPILMTAVTTIAGALPVALSLGAGGESRAPMGIAAAGGMTTSTLLTLFVIPVVYTLLDDLVKKITGKNT
ncbi:MAG: efflux RND transporter permease subunit, partial [Proteobacteria bacterium]|nr:efflux RND transporter permease subunit [Pseudomonadota bacterium]